jgi:N-methylhydantoinase B
MDGVHSVSNTKNTPIEELELNYPIFMRRYALRENSEGAGKYRGGLGIIREFEFLTDVSFATVSDRQKFRPWGIGGGGEALGTEYSLISGKVKKPVRTKSMGTAKKGDVLRIRTAGGGGYGNPKERLRESIKKDTEDGKISLERAKKVYGW